MYSSMGHFTVDGLLVLQAVIGFLLLYDNVSRCLSLVRDELAQRGAKQVVSWLAYFVPALRYPEEGLNRRYPVPQPTLGGTAIASNAATGIITNNSNDYQTQTDDFKVRINGNVLMVEILDGGLCLEDEDDNICLVDESPIQRAIAAALSEKSTNDLPVNRLELVASFMRADLNDQMVCTVLQRLPDLQFLQLGGISLTVQDMTQILRHESLQDLKNITLCDVEFLVPRNPDIEDDVEEEEENDDRSLQSTDIPLQLRKFVCLFSRLESGVTLDPLLETLQKASNLEQFELVMDHNHSYHHGQPRQPGVAAQSIFSHVALANMLQATRQLKIFVLEYVPLNTLHINAISRSLGHTDCHWDDLRLVNDKDSDSIADTDWTSLTNVLQHDRSTFLQKLSLDGVTRDSHQVSLLLESLCHNDSIMDLRLRNLPLPVESMRSFLSTNTTVQVLFLQCNSFDQEAKEQDQVFAFLLKVLKEQNTTLKRLNYKHALCARTEVFPRRRKPKRCYTERFALLPKQSDDNKSSWKLQQQIHWYLTLNERGIRQDQIMVDVSQSRMELLQLLLNQQHEDKSTVGAGKDSYDLDCIFHLLGNQPWMCSTAPR